MPLTVWLPLPAADIPGLPEGPVYVHWDGEGDFPADPADADFYVPPYLKGAEVANRPLRHGARPRVVQTLTAGTDHVQAAVEPGTLLCNARGVHEASTAELALALTLASLRGIPHFVHGQDAEEWRARHYPPLPPPPAPRRRYGALRSALEGPPAPLRGDVVPR